MMQGFSRFKQCACSGLKPRSASILVPLLNHTDVASNEDELITFNRTIKQIMMLSRQMNMSRVELEEVAY